MKGGLERCHFQGRKIPRQVLGGGDLCWRHETKEFVGALLCMCDVRRRQPYNKGVFSVRGYQIQQPTVFNSIRQLDSATPSKTHLSGGKKHSEARSLKSLVFPVIDVSGLEYAAGAKFVNVPSALQSISARAGASLTL